MSKIPLRILCPKCNKEIYYVIKISSELSQFLKRRRLHQCPYCGEPLNNLSQMKLVITTNKDEKTNNHKRRLRSKPWAPPW